jgi:hypothetical protein
MIDIKSCLGQAQRFELFTGDKSRNLFQHVKQLVRRGQSMKVEALKQRLNRNRPMTTVTIRMPEDVVEELKKVAPLLGFSGY